MLQTVTEDMTILQTQTLVSTATATATATQVQTATATVTETDTQLASCLQSVSRRILFADIIILADASMFSARAVIR